MVELTSERSSSATCACGVGSKAEFLFKLHALEEAILPGLGEYWPTIMSCSRT